MKKIFITGSSRGLGLEFTKQYLDKGETIIASCRDPGKAYALQELQVNYPDTLTILQLDVTEEDERNKAFDQIEQNFGVLDLLINNAGIISGDEDNLYNLGEVYKEDFSKILLVNSISPLLLSEKFLPLLEKGDNAKIINISSMNGCITRRVEGGKYSYCTSKAALNMITKILSNDLRKKGIIALALHPGWVLTDMGGKDAPLEKEESISMIIEIIEKVDISDSGKFLDWQGNELPW